jgi:hypothetical protein
MTAFSGSFFRRVVIAVRDVQRAVFQAVHVGGRAVVRADVGAVEAIGERVADGGRIGLLAGGAEGEDEGQERQDAEVHGRILPKVDSTARDLFGKPHRHVAGAGALAQGIGAGRGLGGGRAGLR